MKKLTSISPWIWVVCCLLIISTVGLLYFVLNYEIEKTFNINLHVDENKKMILLAPEKYSFYIEKGKKITIKHDHKFYDLVIKDFANINGTLAINFGSIPKKLKLVKNTNLDAILYYGQTKILSLILP